MDVRLIVCRWETSYLGLVNMALSETNRFKTSLFRNIFPLFWLAAYNKQNVWTPEGWYVWEDHDKEMSTFIDVIKSQEWPDN